MKLVLALLLLLMLTACAAAPAAIQDGPRVGDGAEPADSSFNDVGGADLDSESSTDALSLED